MGRIAVVCGRYAAATGRGGVTGDPHDRGGAAATPPPGHVAPGWRRAAAFAVDYGIIVLYLGFLTLVGALGRAVGAVPTDVAGPTGRVVAQLVVFAVLTVPVTAWLAGWEAGPGGATPGKRLLGLRVLTTGGDRLTWPRSLLRTGLKITLPWELAHTAVWNLLVWPANPDAAFDLVLLGLANAAIVVNVASLFVGTRRTPYDRAAGTLVVAGAGRAITAGLATRALW